MNCRIVIKTNSHYSYLWPIINDFTKKLGNLSVFIDKVPDFKFNSNIELIVYDKNLSYTERVVHLIDSMSDDYFMLIHDVDLILNLDREQLDKYLSVVMQNDIDRLSLGVFDNPSSSISQNDIHLCKLDYNISKNFFTPFDYAPSIYKRSSIREFYYKFKGESYKNLELNSCAQSYFHKNLSSYGIQKNASINLVYHRGFVYTGDFNFLHITVGGYFLEPDTYFDLKDKFLEIKDTYGIHHIMTQPSSWIKKNEI